MTEAAADYHALPEQGSFSGHGAERVSRRSSQGPSTTVPAASTDKATPLPSGSTDEAMMELGDVDDDAVAVMPRGTPKPLPNAFLGPGYGRNSYFTWRLRMSTLLVAALGIAGIVAFWVSKDIGHGGVQARAILYVAFAVVTFFANFVVLTYFARFREHLSMQLGAFKETDQTGGIRSRLQRRRSKYKSERTRVVNDIRKHLYKETSLGNVAQMETLLEYAKERLGTEFRP
ncbi:uncharacterized protein PITG_06870 [Phytophthora infestans T30-4]|uniref:Transmembrane protein, putative n=1 Tax=Phytophthora infestans (strain T30-4) TaxID=403677 RepID=D0N6N3_PHYIT|nr:uncharacterized protein PITG_06870 [Phytophthora infestans T30-4]EEY53232.1 transmembrane protein, putative [Phytophthora infestans T30-4]|eukprot:XP_002904850.1 transmembrane protein, putative [Phytophthora infestans T30-4]